MSVEPTAPLEEALAVARGRTALTRRSYSRPVRLALEQSVLGNAFSFFDYGCGKGSDVRLLAAAGFESGGWDPAHLPEAERRPADVVNLGYVVNVVEDPVERAQALTAAWALTRQVLIVAARTNAEERELGFRQGFADGVRTSRNTFQKFFEQQELKAWIEQVLATEPVAAAPGIFYVFRDGNAREEFRASRVRQRLSLPSLSLSERRCREHPELVASLVDFFADRGRLPEPDELDAAAHLCEVFGSIKRAFAAVQRINAGVPWNQIAAARMEDLRLYLALSRFERGARWTKLPLVIQRDVRALFGTYAAASRHAEALLFDLGRPGEIDECCAASSVGKLTPTALYVHRSALDRLPLLLRAFEGCARGYVGEVEGANVVKLYRREPKISYLSYPRFDEDAHPALSFSLNVDLRAFRLKTRRFVGQPNPPILHRKECFLAPDHPRRSTYERLTRSEEKAGLLEKTDTIGLRRGWENVLAEKKLVLRGHRLVRASR